LYILGGSSLYKSTKFNSISLGISLLTIIIYTTTISL